MSDFASFLSAKLAPIFQHDDLAEFSGLTQISKECCPTLVGLREQDNYIGVGATACVGVDMAANDLFSDYVRNYEARRQAEMTLEEYLRGCRADPMMYASAPERLLAAIGEPQIVDTARDQRLGRIFMNRTIRTYPSFAEFYGMEETIEQIVELLPPRLAGSRGAQADPLPAGSGRRRQILARRAAEGADGGASDLCAEGRRRDEPGVRKPAGPVRSRSERTRDRGSVRHTRAAVFRDWSVPGVASGSTSSAATSRASRSCG